MKKILLTTLTLSATTLLWAQSLTIREEIDKNPNLSASNSVAYPDPTQEKLTPAPGGKKAFYLSHYGRHGSRYLTKTEDYEYLVRIFKQANEQGKLTTLGKDVLRRILIIDEQAKHRWGDLTEKGAQQHRDIVSRMAKNYPQLFKGKSRVETRSTLVPRCVLSMTQAVRQLASINPKLDISVDASSHDLYYMNYQDKVLRTGQNLPDSLQQVYDAFTARHWTHFDRLLTSLFNDTAYINRQLDAKQMNYYLFRMAGSIQNTTLEGKITLFDIFTPDEIYHNWITSNAWWYLGFAHSPLNNGNQPYTQRHLLKHIIEQADAAIASPQTLVQLRFGHDTMVLPLVCLIDLNGFGKSINDLDKLVENEWADYRVFPMSANIQFVFYRKNVNDKDVLVKILLNEKEATLPLNSSIAPYYHWSDVRQYFLHILSLYKD